MLHPGHPTHSTAAPLVQVLDLTCGYDGTPVLSGVNLTVRQGEFVALLGPSGSGKTTLLSAMLGAVPALSGAVSVAGRPAGARTAPVGYVPQLADIDWDFPVTVEQVVLMGLTVQAPWWPWHRREAREQAHAVMERLGIGHLGARLIRELSGGQQQRAFLARALVRRPSLLLLDEPTTGVDIRTRDEVLHLLHELNHDGAAIVIATHEINAVAAHLPRVVCINGALAGAVVGDGSPDEVFTPQVLQRTYGAELHVARVDGLTLVTEMPHRFGRHPGEADGHGHDAAHQHEGPSAHTHKHGAGEHHHHA
ncbi:MAG: metal ABC transporter ATP-binding protein [Chloroflexota bacterium]